MDPSGAARKSESSFHAGHVPKRSSNSWPWAQFHSMFHSVFHSISFDFTGNRSWNEMKTAEGHHAGVDW